MGLITYEHEYISSIPQSRFYKSFILDADNLIPKALPGAFESFEILEGDGGPGTIKLFTFSRGYPFASVKHRVDEIDEKNYVFKYTVIEGGVLEDVFESIAYVVKVEPGPAGGSVCKTLTTYHTKKDDYHMSEDKIKEGKEKATAVFKVVEAHLLKNPHAYT